MEITVARSGGVTVVVPKGDLDMGSAPGVRAELTKLLQAGHARLIVDLGGVGYIDSAGLGELVKGMKQARAAGGDLRVCTLRGDVLHIFEMTRLDAGMHVYPDREAALKSWD
jgi:anti-sigma B factor antagonist